MNLENLIAYGWFMMGLRAGCRFTWHGRIFLCTVPLCSHQREGSSWELCSIRQAEHCYHSNFDWWHENPRDWTGWLHCPVTLTVSPMSQNLERTCVEKLEIWTRKQTLYIFNKEGIVLKIHEKNVFFFLFIPHTDVIFRQISKYEHMSV